MTAASEQRRASLRDELALMDGISRRQREILGQSERVTESHKNSAKELEKQTQTMEKLGKSLAKNLDNVMQGDFSGLLGDVANTFLGGGSGGGKSSIGGAVGSLVQGFMGGGKGGNPINMIMNIATPDASSFRASQGQVMGDAFQGIMRGQRNL